MKNNNFEKYITELSPELQEKARHCKDMDELNKLLADNDVELSEDALEMVAGGCSLSDSNMSQGDCTVYDCPKCGRPLHYWDRAFRIEGCYNRYYCSNKECVACKENWLFSLEYDGSTLERVK